MGEQISITVDEQLPLNMYGDIAVASSKEDELWVSIAEKAYAKMHKRYDCIEGGHACPALAALTGAPCEVFMLDGSKEDIESTIHDAEKNHWVMTTSSYALEGQAAESETLSGIISSHVYTLMGSYQINDRGRDVSLVKIRNPHGEGGEWKGDWSDNSSKWTPALRKKLGSVIENDGIFFMTIDDWEYTFETFSIAYLEDDYSNEVEMVKSQEAFFTFSLRKPLKDATFIISQPDLKTDCRFPDYEISPARFIIAKKTNDKNFPYEFVGGKGQATNGIDETIIRIDHLDAGEYTVYASVDFPSSASMKEWAF